MKKIIGTILLWVGGLLILNVLLCYVFYSAAMALIFIRPLLIMGACIILAIVGIYLRGDK